MPKRTATERYVARKQRVAVDLRARMLAAAQAGAHHARLRDRCGPDWRGMLDRNLQRQLDEWHNIVERNPYRFPGDPEHGYYEPAARKAFLRYYQNNPTAGGGAGGV